MQNLEVIVEKIFRIFNNVFICFNEKHQFFPKFQSCFENFFSITSIVLL